MGITPNEQPPSADGQDLAGEEPTCPLCGTAVHPDWDWCQVCGFDPDGLRPPGWSPPPVQPLPPESPLAPAAPEDEAGGEPTCPMCGTVVRRGWDWCQVCGYDPDGLKPEQVDDDPSAETPSRWSKARFRGGRGSD